MKVVYDLSNCNTTGDGHVVTIGVYDGVHLGHRSVIELAQRAAADLSASGDAIKSAVVTFDPHPAYIVRSDNAPLLLTPLEHKLELLAEVGVDTTAVVTFDKTRAAESPEQFVQSVLVDCLRAQLVVVGHDFHFGAGRAGNVEVLAKLGARYGFQVEGLQLLPRTDGPSEPVSSTAIRRALAGGNVAVASSMLGRPHEVWGNVIEGDQRGRQIGFPTANIAVEARYAVPADAVYAGWYIQPDGSRWPAAINVGKRPTFYQHAEHSVVEAHLIGFSGSLYGQNARVEFVRLLRSEQRFDGVDALVTQLRVDIDRAKQILGVL